MDSRRIAYLQQLTGLKLTPAEARRLERDLAQLDRQAALLPRLAQGHGSPGDGTVPAAPMPLEFQEELVEGNAPDLEGGFFVVGRARPGGSEPVDPESGA